MNKNGIGGFRSGQPAANPGGRPRGTSRIQWLFLRYCEEARNTAVRIMREPKEHDNLRLAACNLILDRGVGKPTAAVNLNLALAKPWDNMTPEDLLELRKNYVAAMTASPVLIDQILDEDEKQQEPVEQMVLGLDRSDNEDG